MKTFKRKIRRWFETLIGLAGILALAGCAGVNRPLVNSMDRFVNKTVGPEYQDYVSADAKLSPAEKSIRNQNVESMRLLLEEAQK